MRWRRELLPTIVFCFSKRRCDALADSLHSLDMTSGAEKAQVGPVALVSALCSQAATAAWFGQTVLIAGLEHFGSH